MLKTLFAGCIAVLLFMQTDAAAGDLPAAQAFTRLHQASEAIYDGDGSWGHGRYGYRMALRDTAWRAEVYGHLAQAAPPPRAALYRRRADEAIGYLLRAQAEGGAGVFGFPADERNPEFGAKVRAVMAACPACARGGWIVSLPGDKVAELYYDHGHALAAVARAYLRSGDGALLAPLHDAARWALGQPLTRNVNYLSSLTKGLSLAWRATGEPRYLDRAIELHRRGILPFIGATGQARDPHNAQLEYHGFIVSGLVALRQALPEGHPHVAETERTLEATVARMATRGQHEEAPHDATWPGTNLMAWQELSALRPLREQELRARDRARALIGAALPHLEADGDGFRWRKALYSNFVIGWLP